MSCHRKECPTGSIPMQQQLVACAVLSVSAATSASGRLQHARLRMELPQGRPAQKGLEEGMGENNSQVLTGSQWSSWGPSSSSMVASALQAASWTCLLWSTTPLKMPCTASTCADTPLQERAEAARPGSACRSAPALSRCLAHPAFVSIQPARSQLS